MHDFEEQELSYKENNSTEEGYKGDPSGRGFPKGYLLIYLTIFITFPIFPTSYIPLFLLYILILHFMEIYTGIFSKFEQYIGIRRMHLKLVNIFLTDKKPDRKVCKITLSEAFIPTYWTVSAWVWIGLSALILFFIAVERSEITTKFLLMIFVSSILMPPVVTFVYHDDYSMLRRTIKNIIIFFTFLLIMYVFSFFLW